MLKNPGKSCFAVRKEWVNDNKERVRGSLRRLKIPFILSRAEVNLTAVVDYAEDGITSGKVVVEAEVSRRRNFRFASLSP